MGVSGKWIKALIGLNKSEKSQSLEKDGNVGIHFFLCRTALFHFLSRGSVVTHPKNNTVTYLENMML